MRSVFLLGALVFFATACKDVNWFKTHSYAIVEPARYKAAFTELLAHFKAQSQNMEQFTNVYAGPFLVKDGGKEQVAGIMISTVGDKTICFGLVGPVESKPVAIDCKQAAEVRSAIQLPPQGGNVLTEKGKELLKALPAELDYELRDGQDTSVKFGYFMRFGEDLRTLASYYTTLFRGGAFFETGGSSMLQRSIKRIDETDLADGTTRFRIWFGVEDPSLVQAAAEMTAPIVVPKRWEQRSWETAGMSPTLGITSYYFDLEVTSKAYRLTFYLLYPWQGYARFGEDQLEQGTVEIPR
jgi:hypothetical protein